MHERMLAGKLGLEQSFDFLQVAGDRRQKRVQKFGRRMAGADFDWLLGGGHQGRHVIEFIRKFGICSLLTNLFTRSWWLNFTLKMSATAAGFFFEANVFDRQAAV